MQKIIRLLFLLIPLLIGLLACSNTDLVFLPLTPSPLATPTPTLNLPVIAGTPMPYPKTPITANNIAQIEKLAVWTKGTLTDVAYSTDGRYFATASTTGIWVYDAQTYDLLRFIDAEIGVGSLIFLPNSHILQGQIDHNVIATWDVTTGERRTTAILNIDIDMVLPDGGRTIREAVFSPDGKKLIFNSTNKEAELWDIEQNQRISVLPIFIGSPKAFSPDNTRLASYRDELLVWETDTGRSINISLEDTEKQTSNKGTSLIFSHDGKLLIAGRSDATIGIWDIQTGQRRFTLREASDITAFSGVFGLAVSPDNRTLVSFSSGRAGPILEAWGLQTGERLASSVDIGHQTKKLVISPNGKHFASLAFPTEIKIWGTEKITSLKTLPGYSYSLPELTLTKNNQIFVTTPSTTVLEIRDLQTWQVVDRLQSVYSGKGILELSLSENDEILVSGNIWSTTLQIWNLTNRNWIKGIQVYEVTGHPRDMTISPDGAHIAVSEANGVVEIYGVQTEKQLFSLRDIPSSGVPRLAYSSDGLVLASSSDTYSVALWNLEEGKLIHRLEEGHFFAGGLAFSPDNTFLAVGYYASFDEPGEIRLWDVETGELVYTLQGHLGRVVSLAFSPDGSLLVSSAWENTLCFWDVKTGSQLKCTSHPSSQLQFSHDGKLLVTRSDSVQVWGIP